MPRPVAPPPPVASPPPSQLTPLEVKSKTGLFQSIKEGFGFGVGTHIAHKVFGPSAPAETSGQPTPLPNVPPSQEKQKTVSTDHVYNQCILEGGTETFCRQLSDTLE
jgi:hypothetical protein